MERHLSSHILKQQSPFLRFALHQAQGRRNHMEDRTCEVADVFSQFDMPRTAGKENINVAYFAIHDGHGGRACAEYLSQHLCPHLIKRLSEPSGDSSVPQSASPADILLNNLKSRGVVQKLVDAFIETDEKFLVARKQEMREAAERKSSGSTAVVSFIISENNGDKQIHHDIIVANVGDSKAVVYDAGRTIAMTKDHKPYSRDEQQRIYNAGGYVMRNRTNGHLAMSRAFGDLEDKAVNRGHPISEQPVIATPDVRKTEVVSDSQLTNETMKSADADASDLKFVILATDGLWDVMSPEQATSFVVRAINDQKSRQKSDEQEPDIDQIVTQMVETAIDDLESYDNVSVQLVLLS